jgi:hypothetical protein
MGHVDIIRGDVPNFSVVFDIGIQDGGAALEGEVVFLYLFAVTFTTEECSWRNV